MSRRSRAPRTALPHCALTTDEVYVTVYTHAATHPVSTPDLAEYCRARHSDPASITTNTVRARLEWLAGRDRVVSWPGTAETTLRNLGVEDPRPRQRYWMLAPKGQA